MGYDRYPEHLIDEKLALYKRIEPRGTWLYFTHDDRYALAQIWIRRACALFLETRPMQNYQREFIEFLVECEVLTFGDFTTKSGRKTPYFVNTGRYHTGPQLTRLAGFYAAAIEDRFGRDFDVLFGPAYKGIPLSVATAMELGRRGKATAFCFNRKEAKDHGEGGVLIGKRLVDGDRVLIIEDVTTAGTSIKETVPVLRAAANVALVGLVVSVDRMERGSADQTALRELSRLYDMKTAAIVTIDDIVQHLKEHAVDGKKWLDAESLERIRKYRAEYGAPGDS